MTIRKIKKSAIHIKVANRGLYFSHMWKKLKPYIEVEVYDRDGGHRRPRVRFEVHAPPSKLRTFARTKLHCVACGRLVPFVRAREPSSKPGGHYYLAVTCPLTETFACARSGAARDEYKRIKLSLRPDLAVGAQQTFKEPERRFAPKGRRSGQKVGSPSVRKQLGLLKT